jgi:hypothetical protein
LERYNVIKKTLRELNAHRNFSYLYILKGNFKIFFSEEIPQGAGCLGTAVNKKMWTREFTALIVLSALGGAASAPIGYAGRLLSTLPFLSPIFSQTLSGLHIFGLFWQL